MNYAHLKLGVSILAYVAITAGAASAQEQSDAPSTDVEVVGAGLSEIVVTARNRREALQDIPLSVNAFSGDALEQNGAKTLRDISFLSPGLIVAGDETERTATPTIRGLAFNGERGQEANVAVFLDGIYISNSGALSLGLMDFERVEVVKGPQSALYGRNAFAGAINYVSRVPGDEMSAKVEVGAGTDGAYNAILSAGGAIIEGKLRARLAVGYDRFGGTYKDPVNSKKAGGFTKRGVNLLLNMTPTDRITIDSGFYYGDDDFGLPYAISFANNCAFNGVRNLHYCGELPSYNEVGPVKVPTNISNNATGNSRTIVHGRVKATVDFDAVTLEVLSGYFDIKQRDFYDINAQREGLPFTLAGTPEGTVNLNTFYGGMLNTEDFSVEARLSSDAAQPLRWSFGGFFLESDQYISANASINADNIPAGRQIQCLAAFICNWVTPGGRPSSWATVALANARQYSAFGSLQYDLTDSFTVTGEIRYTNERKSNNQLSVATASPTIDPDGPAGRAATFTYWNPRVTATYKVTDANMVYASASKGTKAGGFNSRATLASEAAYGPESNWTYEIGSKNTLLDGRLRLNASAFYIDWTSLQIQVLSANTSQTGLVTQNFGSVQAKGGELEAALVVANGVTINTGLAYTDPKFGSDAYDFGGVALCQLVPSCTDRIVTDAPSAVGPATAVSLDGLSRINASKWQYTANLDVKQPLSEDWSWFAVANYAYQSKQYTQLENIRWIPARHQLNLRLGVETDGLRFTVWGTNLLNDLTPQSYLGGQNITQYNAASGGLVQAPQMILPEQRRFGLTVSSSF